MRTDDFRLDQLRQAVGELAESDVSSLSDGEVRERLPVLLSALGTLGAVLAETVASFDTRQLAEADGCRSVRAWLMAFGRMSAQSATGWLERGRLLRQLPVLAAAARGGAVSTEHLRKVGELVEKHGIAEVARFDGVLGELAAAGTPADLQKACERISAHLDPDGPDPEKDFQRRGLTLSRAGSMVGLRGQLDAEAGAAVLTALDALMAPPGPDDVRTARQRRADALAELARQSLSRGELPTVGGVRPTVGILLQPANLSRPDSAPAGRPSEADRPPGADAVMTGGSAAEPAHLGWFGAVPDELAQRIACDCDVWRAVLTRPRDCRSSSAARIASSPTGCARPYTRATAVAGGRAAARRSPGPTRTTCGPGTTAARPTSTTCSACAASTTARSTRDGGGSNSTGRPDRYTSPAPTADHTR